MNQDKYYIPDIEDIHIGYECEIQSSWGWQKGTWPNILHEDTITGFNIERKGIVESTKTAGLRTPYLTREQIEAEGWIFKSTNKRRYWYEIPDMFVDAPHSPSHQMLAAELIHDPEYNTIAITVKLRSDFEYHTFFEGRCLSINEFRKICKLLNIN